MKARKNYSGGYIYKHENIFNLVQYSTTNTAMIKRCITVIIIINSIITIIIIIIIYLFFLIIIIINIMIIITNFYVTGSFINWCYIDLDFMMIAWNR